MWRPLIVGIVGCFACGAALAQEPPRSASQIGEQIDRGLSQIGTEIREGWAEIRKSVEKMGVQGRVYGRLHWDKELQNATLEIEVRDNHVVVLKGSVPSAAAKTKAAQLARDTVGVNNVIDELGVANAAPK